jgi:hypothetical protein
MADPEMDELEITIDKDGNVTVKVVDGKGDRCVKLTRDLEIALGLVEARDLQPEYYEDEDDVETGVEQQG